MSEIPADFFGGNDKTTPAPAGQTGAEPTAPIVQAAPIPSDNAAIPRDFFSSGGVDLNDPAQMAQFNPNQYSPMDVKSSDIPQDQKATLENQIKSEGFGNEANPISAQTQRFLIGKPYWTDSIGGENTFQSVGGAVGGTAGAVLGGTAGIAGGPAGVAAGTLSGGMTGGILGSMAGEALYNATNVVQDFIEFGHLAKENDLTTTLGLNTALNQYASAATQEAASQVAGPLFVKAVGSGLGLNWLVGKVVGVTPPGRFNPLRLISSDQTVTSVNDVLDRGNSVGINTGVVDAPSKWADMYAKVIGKLPLVSMPFGDATKQKFLDIDKNIRGILDTLAPATNLFDMGLNLENAANRTVFAKKRIAAQYYQAFQKGIEDIGNPAIVPTADIKAAYQAVYDRFSNLPQTMERLEFGRNPDGTKSIDVVRDRIGSRMGEENIKGLFKGDYMGLPDFITVTEARALKRDLNVSFSGLGSVQGKDPERNALKTVMGGVETAINNIGAGLTPERQAALGITQDQVTDILQNLSNGNKAFADAMQTTQTNAARMVKRPDKAIFNQGVDNSPTLDSDRLADTLVSSKNFRSPEFIDDLENLVGKDNVGQVARLYLERNIVGVGPGGNKLSTEFRIPTKQVNINGEVKDIAFFDAQATLDRLGLGKSKSVNETDYKTSVAFLDKMLKASGSGLSAHELEQRLSAMAQVQNTDLSSVSTYLARRMAFTGSLSGLDPFGGLAKGATGAGAAAGAGALAGSPGGGLVAFGLVVAPLYYTSKLLASKEGADLIRYGVAVNKASLGMGQQATAYYMDKFLKSLDEVTGKGIQVQGLVLPQNITKYIDPATEQKLKDRGFTFLNQDQPHRGVRVTTPAWGDSSQLQGP